MKVKCSLTLELKVYNNRRMIKTKSIYSLVEAADGKRFLISRYWPRGLSKAKLRLSGWIRELAPSKELLQDWKKNKISWQEYEQRYSKEMESNQQFIGELANLAETSTITLLCFEKEDNPHCHRHLLKQMIETKSI